MPKNHHRNQQNVEMIGDKLVITEYRCKASASIYNTIENIIKSFDKPFTVTVASESGSGKSETARVLTNLRDKAGYRA